MRNQHPWSTMLQVIAILSFTLMVVPADAALDADAIGNAAGTKATTQADGVVRIGWSRTDVELHVDGMLFKPQAGLGSWAAFKETPNGAMIMGDTVVFQDETDAAMDAAFAGGLEVTAIHNHFYYDDPKVYFMHIGGQGDPAKLAAGVKGMWDAVKAVRSANPTPATRFPGPIPAAGSIDASVIDRILGTKSSVNNGVVKASFPREGTMNGITVGGTMGLSTWAAFSGSDDLAAVDGDFMMTAAEVQPVLRAMRKAGFHVVSLHNHMTGEKPPFYFTHYWATGSVKQLAQNFKAVLNAQAAAGSTSAKTSSDTRVIGFDKASPGAPGRRWHIEGTNQEGPMATWTIAADASAPSTPNVLSMTKANHRSNGTFNLCWFDGLQFRDGSLSLRFKANDGMVDGGGGPIWRAQDKDNYYVCRANPLEDNFRLYTVKGGKRTQLASAKLKIPFDKWHSITVNHQGDQIECYLNGEKLLAVTDDTFPDSGYIGLWTKADAATSFDDITVTVG